jgi:hypothetical protein
MNYCIDAPVIEFPGYPPVIFIEHTADKKLKDLLAGIASNFKKEMRFDHLQYDDSMHRTADIIGVLFLHRAMDLVEHDDHFPCRVVGGGVFVDRSGRFELDWVWLHPFFRNRNRLRNNWKLFQKRFGHFSVAPPLSAHMSLFIKKHHAPAGEQKQVKY